MKLTECVYLVGSGLWDLSLTPALDCNVYLLDGGGELTCDVGPDCRPQT